jgi:hypothetical protein
MSALLSAFNLVILQKLSPSGRHFVCPTTAFFRKKSILLLCAAALQNPVYTLNLNQISAYLVLFKNNPGFCPDLATWSVI